MNHRELEAAQVAHDSQGARLAASLVAIEALLAIVERQRLELEPLDRLAVDGARRVLTDQP